MRAESTVFVVLIDPATRSVSQKCHLVSLASDAVPVPIERTTVLWLTHTSRRPHGRTVRERDVRRRQRRDWDGLRLTKKRWTRDS